MNTATVVICAFTDRRWAPLVASVDSAIKQTHQALEVLVVIDHNDELLSRATERFATMPAVRVLASAAERGLSGARNTGVFAARGTVVAFLDDDATAKPGWLGKVLSAHDEPDVVGTGGLASPAWESRTAPRWFPSEFLWVVGCSYRGLPGAGAALRNPIGANMSFLRDALVEAGGFAAGIGRVGSLPMGCEETELAIRIRAARPGSRIVHVPSAQVAHLVPDDRARIRYFLHRCWSEGRSKAMVADRVGQEQGLASERRYATRVLPAGVVRGLAAALRGDIWGIGRALAIVVGLGATTAGYARGILALNRPDVGLLKPEGATT